MSKIFYSHERAKSGQPDDAEQRVLWIRAAGPPKRAARGHYQSIPLKRLSSVAEVRRFLRGQLIIFNSPIRAKPGRLGGAKTRATFVVAAGLPKRVSSFWV